MASAQQPLTPAAVLAWFSGHSDPSVRIEVAVRMLLSLNMMELRFVATCVNQLDKRNYHKLRQTDAAANEAEQCAQLLAGFDVGAQHGVTLLIVAVASLRASSAAAANFYFSLISRLEQLRPLTAGQLDKPMLDLYLTLLSIGRNHPAFSIGQRLQLTALYMHLAKTHSSEAEAELADRYAPLDYDQATAAAEDAPPPKTDQTNGSLVDDDDEPPAVDDAAGDGVCVRCHEKHGLAQVCVDDRPAESAALLIAYPTRIVAEQLLGNDVPDWRFVYKVEWSDGGFTEVDKTYADVHSLHHKLLDHYPREAGYRGCRRLIPYLPVLDGSVPDSKERLREDIRAYIRDLLDMPPRLLASSDANEFFGRGLQSTGKRQPSPRPDRQDSAAAAAAATADVVDAPADSPVVVAASSPPPPSTGAVDAPTALDGSATESDGGALPQPPRHPYFRLPQRLFEAMRDTKTIKFKPWMHSVTDEQAAQWTLADIITTTGLAESSSRELFKAIERLRQMNVSAKPESWDSDDGRSVSSSRRGPGPMRSGEPARNGAFSGSQSRRAGGRSRPPYLNNMRQQQRVQTSGDVSGAALPLARAVAAAEQQLNGPDSNWLNSHENFPTLSETGSPAPAPPRHRRGSDPRPIGRGLGCGSLPGSPTESTATTPDARPSSSELPQRRARPPGGFGVPTARGAFRGAMPAGCGVPFAAGYSMLDGAAAARLGLQHHQLYVLPQYTDAAPLQIPHSIAPPRFHAHQPQPVCSCAQLGCPTCVQLYGHQRVGGHQPHMVWPEHLRALSASYPSASPPVLRSPYDVLLGVGAFPYGAESSAGGGGGAMAREPMRPLDEQQRGLVLPLMKGGGKLSCCNCGKAGHLKPDCGEQTIDQITEKGSWNGELEAS